MAKKKMNAAQCKAMGLPDDLIEKATAAAVPFGLLFQLWMQFGGKAIDLIRQIVDAWQNPTPPVMQAKKATAGCCDHRTRCTETFQLALSTVDSAAAHLAECCVEQPAE